MAAPAIPPGRRVDNEAGPPDADATPLAQAIVPLVRAHPGLSGIHWLRDGLDAFAARFHLAQTARRSLDVQYYLWHDDLTGRLLFEALHAAAERGVKVRLLLDDNNAARLDATLAALDSHPNLEVRLFNAFKFRRARWLGYLFDFTRLNRRMHNKSFSADGQATIVGGRNVGDEYFGAAAEWLFVDLDVLAVGPVVQAVVDDFERYWNSSPARPAAGLLRASPPGQLAALSATAAQLMQAPAAQAYATALRESTFIAALQAGRLPLDWAPARLVSDDPAKVRGRAARKTMVAEKLLQVIGEPRRSLALVSAYFVPTRSGVAAFAAMAARGLQVRILTNALEATDVTAVHAGYAPRRKALLRAGVTLFELQRLSARRRRRGRGRFGRSASSLHAKTFAVDGERAFVGSFNFDPRSARLNTEMGLVVDSAKLARRIEAAFVDGLADHAYEVRLRDSGRLYWREGRHDGAVEYEHEPGAGVLRRAFVWCLSRLPIEWLL